MPILTSVGGVIREVGSMQCGVDGVLRDTEKAYCGVEGVTRELFNKIKFDFDFAEGLNGFIVTNGSVNITPNGVVATGHGGAITDMILNPAWEACAMQYAYENTVRLQGNFNITMNLNFDTATQGVGVLDTIGIGLYLNNNMVMKVTISDGWAGTDGVVINTVPNIMDTGERTDANFRKNIVISRTNNMLYMASESDKQTNYGATVFNNSEFQFNRILIYVSGKANNYYPASTYNYIKSLKIITN